MICIGNPGHRFKFLLISGGHIGAPKRYTNMAIFAGSFHAPSQSFVWRRQIGVPLLLHHLVDVFYLKNNSVLARFRNLDEISARFWPPTFRRSRRDLGENFVLELSSCSNKGIVSQQVSNGTKHPNTNSNYLRLFFSCRD